MQNFILIGGTPTAGKSTAARDLSKVLGIPWISTDQIRATMRLVANRENYPNLFNSEDYDAERFLTELSAQEIVEMEMKQCETVWIGIKELVENDYDWTDGGIIEGVAVLPHLVARDFVNQENIRTVFLLDENVEQIRQTVFSRGLWDDADTYADSVKEKEVEWVVVFNQVLKAEIKEFNYPYIEVQKNTNDMQALLEALNLQI